MELARLKDGYGRSIGYAITVGDEVVGLVRRDPEATASNQEQSEQGERMPEWTAERGKFHAEKLRDEDGEQLHYRTRADAVAAILEWIDRHAAA